MRDSDGYIIIDMSAADISKSTQNIPGIFDRIHKVIDTNKLVLVINFGDYSPMPAIAHKKLNYYVITTNLFIITINSNNVVVIEESGETTVDVSIVPTLLEGVKIADYSIGEVEGSLYAPEQVDVINDNVTAENTTWSSDKIADELDTKADASSLSAVATSGSYNDLSNTPTIPDDLNDLSDVTLTTPSNGQTLVYNGSEWINKLTSAGNVTYSNTISGLISTMVQGAIDELNAKLNNLSEVSTGTCTLNTINVTSGDVKYVRYGRLVIVSGYFLPSNGDNQAVVFTLPYAPLTLINEIAQTDQSPYCIYLACNANELNVRTGPHVANSYVRFSIVYIKAS